ncbi:alpha/beta hydrolase [Blautia luti]|uniref:alpha/beta hydrolase n=1 Tax=Blautia luti TaxID=89014 RepID=UPI0018AAF8BD|nr:alpha/beta hydrolase [Blautia luti]
MYDLTFDPEKYEIKTCELGNRSITYRAFEHIVYCANPASKIQTLNIYVPEEYYSGKTINGYALNTAPIFAPNTVGGYMEGPAMEVGIDRFNHKPNSAFEALLHGYVVMCAGIRGRNIGMHSKEFFVGGTGKENTENQEKRSGRAPALIVDMKAAIRYMRHNAKTVPGDVEKIITNFKDYVMSFVSASAKKEKETHDTSVRLSDLAVPGSDIDEQEYITFEGNQVKKIDTDAYVKKITRMKPTPAFDALSLESPENEEFGDDEVMARHFTEFAEKHSKVGGVKADEQIIKLLNPTKFIGECDTTKNWRIRHGAFDRDTSIAIPVILATMLKNKGYEVDFSLPWGLPHSGDYDLEELFEWIDKLAK